MMYVSYTYLLLFLGVTFILYTAFPKRYKWTVLLSFSYLFYYANMKHYIFFLLGTTVSIYLCGIIMNKIDDGFTSVKQSLSKDEKKDYKKKIKRKKKTTLLIFVFINLGLLAFLKYYNFFASSLNLVFEPLSIGVELPKSNLLLPLGISFYTLQALSYIIDVYRGKYRDSNNLGKVALFLSFFPQIVEGPIGRFDLLADNLYEGHKFNYENVTYGLKLIVWGLFKKMVIADRADAFVKTVFENHQNHTGTIVIIAMLLYTVQIYAEFSGCMDIVRGSAKLFSVNLSKNFERPFFSKSISEFWRRWHMTLGSWFRDYIFYPISLSKGFLKLNKGAKKRLKVYGGMIAPAIAMFFVWFSTGLWHGASFKYIVYGLYYYVIMLIGMFFEPLSNKLLDRAHINKNNLIYKLFQIIRTCILVNFGMLLFRADNLTVAFEMFKSMFVNVSLAPITDGTILTLGIDKFDFVVIIIGVLALFVMSLFEERGHHVIKEISAKNIVIRWTVYFIFIFAVIIFGAYGTGYGVVDLIYSNF